jgi:ribosome maturation factor RimP
MTQVNDIWNVVEPYLAAERLELDDLEMLGSGKGRILRVTVDGEGVDVDRLADISYGISRLLDNETDLDGQYQLEVSSPGLERKLKRPAHFAKSISREVVVKFDSEGAVRTVRGILADADDTHITIDGEDGPIMVPFDRVVSAKTVFRWEKAPKPGKKVAR